MSHSKTEQTTTDRLEVCQTVVADVAAALDKKPEELQTPLYDVIDPEAVERVFEGTDDNDPTITGYISFEYIGCSVTVSSTGEVKVSPPRETSRANIADASNPVMGDYQSHD